MRKRATNWYAGHAIFLFKLKSGRQSLFSVWENIYLIRADSFDDAIRRTKARGREDEEKEGWRVDGKPAKLVFEGVRKVVECTPDYIHHRSKYVDRPHDGMEVTFNSYRLNSRRALRALLRGEEVVLTYEE